MGKLSAAIIEAVRRDFVKGERRLSPELAELTPQLLQDVAREHLRCIFLHQVRVRVRVRVNLPLP